MKRNRNLALVATLSTTIDRLLRSRRSGHGHAKSSADDPVPQPAPSSGPQPWLIHPDIEAIMDELGIGDFVLPRTEDMPILRARVPAGGYWRIEHVPRPGRRLDHAIQRRGNLHSPMQSVTTVDGTMEVVIDLGDLPDVVAAAIPGQRLGDLVGLAAPAGDSIVEDTHRRVMAATRPTVLVTASRGYVPRETHS